MTGPGGLQAQVGAAMADAALAGLTPEEARAVEAGVFRA